MLARACDELAELAFMLARACGVLVCVSFTNFVGNSTQTKHLKTTHHNDI
jgi:hypothetical protein